MASWNSRTISRAAPAAPASTNTEVRWSGTIAPRSSSSSGTRDDLLVGQPEPLQHGDRRRRVEMLEQRELHVGQHERAVALRDQQRAGELGEVDGAAVDDACVTLHRVDAEAHPGEVGERDARDQHEVDVRVASRSNATVRSATAGLPGTAYTTSPCSPAASTSAPTISAYACSRSGAAS